MAAAGGCWETSLTVKIRWIQPRETSSLFDVSSSSHESDQTMLSHSCVNVTTSADKLVEEFNTKCSANVKEKSTVMSPVRSKNEWNPHGCSDLNTPCLLIHLFFFRFYQYFLDIFLCLLDILLIYIFFRDYTKNL